MAFTVEAKEYAVRATQYEDGDGRLTAEQAAYVADALFNAGGVGAAVLVYTHDANGEAMHFVNVASARKLNAQRQQHIEGFVRGIMYVKGW